MKRHRRSADHIASQPGHMAAFARRPVNIAVTLALLSLNPGWLSSAAASPTGGQVAAGAATIQQPTPQSTVVNQATPRAVLNWQSFGIGVGESVIFRQPSSSAVALNRVVGPEASVISGSLQANGHVFLVNPSGVLFSKGASVDVGGLVASTLAISNTDFMSGQYMFSGGAGAGAVVNEGSIRAADGGYVALIGNQVSNTGTIVANAGSVALGAGDTMLLDFEGDGLMSLKVNAAAAAARIDHGGVIQADGGRVIMSAQAKNALTATAVNVDGIVRARGIEQRNGEIFLDGGRSGVTSVSGTLDASSANAGQKGGEIRVLGEYVGLFANASLDASGAAGGGTILLGGDFQGRNPEIANAFRAYVAPDATIKADASTNGDGGNVIVWADDTTQFYGRISARGGAESGNGGFVETSGKRLLNASGAVDLGAVRGHGGTWLLDPNNLTISAAANDKVSPGNPFQTTDDDAVLNAGTLGAALTGGADVRVQTTNSGANTQAGTITVAATVTATGAATLSLDAQSDIIFTAAGQINSDGANALSVNLNAGSDAAFTTPGTNASVITMANGSGITTSGGNVAATARGNVQLAGINTGAGSLAVNTTSAGAITQASALTVGGTTNLTAGAANDITLSAANNFGGAVSVASGNNVTLNDSNAIELGASTIGSLAVTGAGAISITGAITATGGGAVSLTATGASGSITESGAGLINTAGTLTTNSVAGQTLSGANDVGALSATNTTSGAVSFNDSDGVSVSGSNTGGAAFNVTAGGAGTITVNAGNINANTGSVMLQADEMVLTGTVTGNGGVTLRPNTAGTPITLGVGTVGLDFTNTALQQVFTTGVLAIGADSAPAAGSITIDGPMAGGTNWTTLALRTAGAVVDGNAAAGPDINVGNGVTQGNLAIRAATGIGSSADPFETSGGGNANGLNLAYSNPGAGGVSIANTGRLNIAAVDGLTASNGGTGATTLSASSPVTIAADVIQVASIDMTAGEKPAPGAGDDLTVNTGVTVRSTGGDVTLRAGDQVTLSGTALVESTNAGGAVALIAGFNDNDTVGAINGAGRASAPNVVLDSLTGIGSAGTRFNTTAGTLAARTRTSGDVFITEFDGVILDTLGGVGNGTNGGGQYNLFAPGTIAINGPNSTTPTAAGAAGGAVTITAGGAITSSATGTIATTGAATAANATPETAAAGGEVLLHSTAGGVTLSAAITASGGASSEAADTGGAGGVVTIRSDSGNILAHNIATNGGAPGGGAAGAGGTIQLRTGTAGNTITQQAGTALLAHGGVPGTSDGHLKVDSMGAVTLTNAGNDVGASTLAAIVRDAGAGFSYTDANALGIGTVTAASSGAAAMPTLSGITTNGGPVRVTAGGMLQVDQAIATTPVAANTAGGSVMLQSGGAMAFQNSGTVATTGSGSGAGGEVFFHRAGPGAGDLTLANAITATGGPTGEGGIVTMVNDNGGIGINAGVDVSRGAGSAGNDGTVQLRATGSITGDGALRGDVNGTLVAKTIAPSGVASIALTGGGSVDPLLAANAMANVALVTGTNGAGANGSIVYLDSTGITIPAGSPGFAGTLVSTAGTATSSVFATGVSTIAGPAGAVRLSALGPLTVNQSINTFGGGSVILSATGAITTGGAGGISTMGRSGAPGASGGEVFIHRVGPSAADIVLGQTIDARGGGGQSNGDAGGPGGVVTIVNDNGSIAMNASIDASGGVGGSGGAEGNGGTIQLRTANPTAAAGTITQTASIRASGTVGGALKINASDTVTLLGISNVFATLAATVTGAGKAFSYDDVSALTIGTVPAAGTLTTPLGAAAQAPMSGITTNGGAVTVTTRGALTSSATGAITTIGAATAANAAPETAAAGGEVLLYSTTGGIALNAGITASGGASAEGGDTAGAGGVVTIRSDGGNILVHNITTDGGAPGGGTGGAGGTIQLRRDFGFDTIGQQPGTALLARGGVPGTADGHLKVQSGGTVTLTNAGNDVGVGTLAARVNGIGAGFSYTDANAVGIGTVAAAGTGPAAMMGSLSGITTNGGAVTINAADISSTAAGMITTTAALASATASGAVALVTSGAGAVNLLGDVTTTGADNGGGCCGAGSAAGAVSITTDNGPITLANVTARGGVATGGNENGGAGGAITVTPGGGNSITLNGNLLSGGGKASGTGTGGAGGPIALNGPVLLGANVTVSANGGTGAADGTGGDIDFAGMVNGAFILSTSTTGMTTFAGALGSATPLTALSTDAPGTTAINGGAVTTNGAQTYNDAVVLGADTTFTSTAGGDIAFAGSVSGGFGLTGVTSGTMTFGGIAAGLTVLASLTTDAGGSTVVIGGGITTTGAQTYNDPVMLGSDTALMSTGAGDIRFNNTLNGGFALALNTAGATIFGMPVGGVTPLAALTTNAAGTTLLNGGSIVTTGAQTYNDAVTLGMNTTLASTGGANIVFANTVDGAFALAANTSGVTTFGGVVGGVTALAEIITDAGGTTTLNGGSVTTTGAQTYNDALTLGADATLTSSAGGAITAAASIDGAANLVLNTAGVTTLGGPIGVVTALTSLITDAPGTTAINGGGVTTTGAQIYNDAVTLGANAVLTSTGAGGIAFLSTLDGASALTANTAGATTFAAPIGATAALASLSTDASGTTMLNGGTVTTTGAQSYGDAATLGANTTLTSTGGGAVSFGNVLDGGFALAANTAGITSFNAAVGSTTALVSISTDAPGSTALSGGAVTTTGAQMYNDAAVLGADTALTSTGGGGLTFAAVDGGFALAANTGGTTTLGGPVGATIALASLTTDAPGTTVLNGATVTTGGNQTYTDAVTLGANPTLTSTGGNVAFASTIDADAAANNRALTVNASAGTVTFSGNIGATQALADLDVTAGPTTIVFNGAPSQTVNVSAQGGNTATFNGPVVLATNLTVTSDGAADNNIAFAGTVNADAFANNRTLTVTSGTATTTFAAAVGNTEELGALSISAGQLELGGNVSVTGGGAVDLSNVMSIAFASGTTIDTDRTGGATAGGDVRFNAASFTNTAAPNAGFAIDASADNGAPAGDVMLGTIGNANSLDQLAVLGDTVTFAGPVSARQVSVTANTVVTPTGQIRAMQPFGNDGSNANAALMLRGLMGPGQFGTRDAPIQIDAPGLFVVMPNMPNTLPFVFLAGDPNKSPVYQFANDPTHRRVFYNGAAPDSPADRAAQGAITQQLRSLLDELAMAGFAKENIRKQLLQGIVLETGLARPGIDEFEGEGVTGPPSCEPDPAKAAKGALIC